MTTVAQTQAEKAVILRSLHQPGNPLVLVNAWDALSARLAESLGAPAIATTSAGVANVEGFSDGERISRDAMLARVALVARTVRVPVTADLEAGYGSMIEDARTTAAGAIAAGAVGLNFEDGDESRGTLFDVETHVARVAAIRQVADDIGISLVINARTDPFLLDLGESDEWCLAEALARGRRYLQAGADCIFVPGVVDEATIGELVRGMGGPVSVLAFAKSPSLARLGELGVARVSLGSGAMGYAYAAFRRAFLEVRDSGTFSFVAERVPGSELNALFEH